MGITKNSMMLNFLENFSGDNSIKSNSCERDNDGIDIDMVQLKRAQDMATLPESSQLLFPPNPDNMTTFENTDPATGDKETVSVHSTLCDIHRCLYDYHFSFCNIQNLFICEI